jgi:hypothetical protein
MNALPVMVPFPFGEALFPCNPQVNMLIAEEYGSQLNAATNGYANAANTKSNTYANKAQHYPFDGELITKMIDSMENFVLLPGIFKVCVEYCDEEPEKQSTLFSVIERLLRIRDKRIKGTFLQALTIVQTLTRDKKHVPVNIVVTVDRDTIIRRGTETLNMIFGRQKNYGIENLDLATRLEIKQLTERMLLQAVAEVEDVGKHRIISRFYTETGKWRGDAIQTSEKDATRYYFTLSALGYLLKNAKKDTGILAKIYLETDPEDCHTGYSYFDKLCGKMFLSHGLGAGIRFFTFFCGWLVPMFKRHFLEVPEMVIAGDGENVYYDYFNGRKELLPIEICLGKYAYLRRERQSENIHDFLGYLHHPENEERYHDFLSSCPKIVDVLDIITLYVRGGGKGEKAEM